MAFFGWCSCKSNKFDIFYFISFFFFKYESRLSSISTEKKKNSLVFSIIIFFHKIREIIELGWWLFWWKDVTDTYRPRISFFLFFFLVITLMTCFARQIQNNILWGWPILHFYYTTTRCLTMWLLLGMVAFEVSKVRTKDDDFIVYSVVLSEEENMWHVVITAEDVSVES